ncbi:cytochrome c biogenesis protein CcsA [Winogradskyella sp. 3972H.M.0a.05]|uniref:cytochrome c biogenesis protein CcsA n=1 Tax=Winogradskyella sp. 3972H.M.0a.05 TaxID=2950277 RepID=UPI00339AEC52
MLKNLSKILFSTKLTAVLFIVFAVAMATGTILDRNMDTSPTPYTRTLIYNAWWFEAIMGFFIINFVGNVFRFKLYRKEKWATFILHLAFIFILGGAFITRYFGYEGMMPIREGASESTFLSQKTYILGRVIGDYKINGVLQQRRIEEEVDFSERLDNEFKKTFDYGDEQVTIELEKFIQGAEKDIKPDDNGESYLKIVESTGGQPHNHFLKDGQVQSIHGVLISLNKPMDGAINITNDSLGLNINSPFEGEYMQMATGNTGALVKDSIQPLMLRSRYIIGNMQIVFPKPVVTGTFDIVKKARILKGDAQGMVLKVSANGETKHVNVLGGPFQSNPYEEVKVGGLDIALQYGAKVLQLPFDVKLNDFIAPKRPGTDNVYESFESKVTVLDKDKGDFDYHIYMNNILDHRGYRFFQADFDPDEKGTVLSVNHDAAGTWVTYIGYFMLYFGLMAILFAKHTRFDDLRKQLEKVKTKKSKIATMVALLLSVMLSAQTHSQDDGHEHSEVTTTQIDSILVANVTPEDHAAKFGALVIQDFNGRMKPMDTYASELLRKLSKNETYAGLNANQILLSMQESPQLWYNVPIIYLKKRKGDSIRKIIGVSKDEKYVRLIDFFDERLNYKLDPYLEEAYSAQIPNGFQKEFKETDQRVSLLFNTIEGQTLKIFPVPEDDNNTWISSHDFRREGYRETIKDSLYGNFINNGFSAYLLTLNQAKQTGDFSKAESLLEGIKKTQQKIGAEVMLSDEKINSEIRYNKYDIFKKLFSWYMYAGTLLFIILIVKIFNDRSKLLRILSYSFQGVIILLFLMHTAGLIWRWTISGHAPWSDAYESMIYVAWATMFFGLAFGRKSALTIAATAFVASMILMIAHWNWMDPSIANLQPVLDSYWLMIHVAVIVASYGPFTLGMILGVVALILMIFTTKSNREKMLLNVKELTIINEMALTVGLVMLTIGNFLGGMWANESWGRYWGWDPKETWALISIMIYAFVIHMRLVPGLRGRWFYNLMSILAFGSILMTYFGVNFYLSGLHSYASGDQILSFQFIAGALVIIAILASVAYYKYKLHYKK